VHKDSLTRLSVGQTYGPYVDGNEVVVAKMVGIKQWPDSVTVRHILVATADPRSGQEIRPDSVGKKLIDSIQAAIKGGADFNALCAKYSDDPGSKDKNGVYDYFEQGKMVIPFNDFCFDNSVGTKGVVKTDYGYHYVEILGQKNLGPAYKIAYLAKPISASSETISAANTAAAQFAVSSKDPKQYNANALKANKQVLGANDIKQNDFTISGIGQSRTLVRWVYEHGAGDISDPFEVGDNFVVAMVTAINKAGLISVAEARPRVESIIKNEKKAKLMIDTKFKGNSLEAYATSSGASVARADSLSFAAPFINGVGNEPKIIGTAFNKSLVGKASEPIAGETGVFAIKVESIGAKATTTDPATVKQGLLQSAKMFSYRGGITALRAAATIKDYRSKIY
jgi:peptidyl-prolyl cis-trans isomerase D